MKLWILAVLYTGVIVITMCYIFLRDTVLWTDKMMMMMGV